MNEERRLNITQRECDLRHYPIDDFTKEAKETFDKLWKKMDRFNVLLISVLIAIITELVITIVKG